MIELPADGLLFLFRQGPPALRVDTGYGRRVYDEPLSLEPGQELLLIEGLAGGATLCLSPASWRTCVSSRSTRVLSSTSSNSRVVIDFTLFQLNPTTMV
jgi:hypothetical protein